MSTFDRWGENVERQAIRFQYNDGGRKDAGFKGNAGDCVVRAIAIATAMPYADIYRELARRNGERGGMRSARSGTSREVYQEFLEELGFEWVPTMQIGSGCKVHVREDELPSGTLILRLSKHLTTVIDGVLHDTYDCSRSGTRAVYGYFRKRD